MPEITILLATIIGSGGLGAIATAWINKRPDPVARENTLIDQLQEMVEGGARREEAAQARADKTMRQLAAAQRREMMLTEYAWACQDHINKGNPPPPPAWPAELLAG